MVHAETSSPQGRRTIKSPNGKGTSNHLSPPFIKSLKTQRREWTNSLLQNVLLPHSITCQEGFSVRRRFDSQHNDGAASGRRSAFKCFACLRRDGGGTVNNNVNISWVVGWCTGCTITCSMNCQRTPSDAQGKFKTLHSPLTPTTETIPRLHP